MKLAIAGAVALLLAIWWLGGPPVQAGPGCEGDGDGVPCGSDNCSIVPNGPFAGTGACVNQEDGDQDGYGNACDTDTNNDLATGLDDVSAVLTGVSLGSTDSNLDFNCDGATGLDDVSRALSDVGIGATPGPSDLPCAGSVPCP